MNISDLNQRPAYISLAKKALMVFTAVMLGQLLVSYLILKSVVAPAFSQLEESNAQENASRVRAAISSEYERLNSINQDWSAWDAAYDFAKGENPQFVSENITNDLLSYLRVDWMCFVNNDKLAILEQFGVDAEGHPLTVRSLFGDDPALPDSLISHTEGDRGIQTVMATEQGPMLVSSFPVLRNEGQGYPAGALLIGRLMSPSFNDQVSKLTEVDFRVLPTSGQPRACPEGSRCDTEPFADINGDAIALLQIRTPSSITALGSTQLNIALKLLALTGLAYLLSVSWLMRRIILAPMSKLAEHIRNVTRTGDLTQRLYLEQRDEIGIVVGNLNAMTNSLERADNQIRRLAYNDALTGLPNRRELDEHLRMTLDSQVNNLAAEQGLTLLFIDLDRFKRVNDLLSHEAGDELLVAAARRLRTCLRIGDRPAGDDDDGKLLARIGGDEFVLAVFEKFDLNTVRGIAKRIIERLEKPFSINGELVTISASIGISAYPKDADDAKALMRNADIAMYRAKEVGGGTFHIYNNDADAADKERVELAQDLRFALERDQLSLYYQPQVDLRTGEIVGCEALIRWHHPERGLVLPGDIISLAEEDGSIESIGRWALKEACVNARRWQLSGQENFVVSVNVSPRQLCRGELIKDVLEALHISDLHPSCLTIEVTESGVMRNTDLVIKTLASLKQLGITIAMDDFGTGYSSLGYLRQLPIDLIKIDRMFIEELATDPEEAALVTAIIAMADSLRRKVVAEGVENQEQVDLLKSQGCWLVQGYFFGAPCPATDFELMLRQAMPPTQEEEAQLRPELPAILEPAH